MPRLIVVALLFCFILSLVAGSVRVDVNASSFRPLPLPKIRMTAQARKPLCEADEKVVFSCTMQTSAKVLSLCTSRQVDAKSGYVQYRFGQPGKIELEFPAERVNTQGAFNYSRYTRPLVTFLKLGFESNGYKYSIHQDSNAEEKPPANSSYLEITPPEENAKPVEMKCRQPVIGSLMLLEDVVPRAEETDESNP